MPSRLILRALLPFAALGTGCVGAASKESFCGHSFCIQDIPADGFSTTGPAEDFVIHRGEVRGTNITIYEGDNPRYIKGKRSSIESPLRDSSAEYLRSDSNEQVVITFNSTKWPTKIAVSGECVAAHTVCEARRLADRFVARSTQ